MRVAAIYDIHANLPALEAVLEEIRQEAVDHVVVGGDVLPGPMPVESLACLMALEVPTSFIVGNGDREVLAVMAGVETPWYRDAKEAWREPVQWTANQLGSVEQRILEGWQATVHHEVAGLGKVLFCHATPRNDWECFTNATSERLLEPIFESVVEPVVVCGHTHMQFDRMVGRVRVVNSGSVGMPYGERGACWLLLDAGVHHRRSHYDPAGAARRIRATNYPQAEDFVSQCIFDPPPEQQMIELFSRAELTP